MTASISEATLIRFLLKRGMDPMNWDSGLWMRLQDEIKALIGIGFFARAASGNG